MGFFDIFRRAPAIREAGALADFIDGNAAFLIQKGMYEYSRARAGHYAKVLLQEPEFLAAIEKVALAGISARPRHGRRDGRKRPASGDRGRPRAGIDALVRAWCCRCSTAIRCRRDWALPPGRTRASNSRGGSTRSGCIRPSW